MFTEGMGMPMCHKCEWNGKGSEKCLTCKDTLSTPCNKGRCHVSIDAGGGQTLGDVEAERARVVAMRSSRRTDFGGLAVSPCCEDAVRRMLGVIMSLDDGQLILFMGLMRGESLRRYARRVGIGKSTASKMLRVMVAVHPELSWRMVNNA
jgi:hypothetical protein